jgi:hypothetical protein
MIWLIRREKEMDAIFLLYWLFTIIYILINIGTAKSFKKYLVVFIYIVGMTGFTLFAQRQIIYQLSNKFIFFNIIKFFASKSLISFLFLS